MDDVEAFLAQHHGAAHAESQRPQPSQPGGYRDFSEPQSAAFASRKAMRKDMHVMLLSKSNRQLGHGAANPFLMPAELPTDLSDLQPVAHAVTGLAHECRFNCLRPEMSREYGRALQTEMDSAI